MDTPTGAEWFSSLLVLIVVGFAVWVSVRLHTSAKSWKGAWLKFLSVAITVLVLLKGFGLF